MAWLFLPENEQVQYLLKIALRAENLSSHNNLISTNKYFLRKQFSAAIGAAHFPAAGTAIDASAAAIFTFLSIFLYSSELFDIRKQKDCNSGYL